MKKIPYSRQSISVEDIIQVSKTLKSDFLTTGPKIEEFEKKIAKYLNVKYAVCVNSATSALHISCIILGLNKSSKFWTSANSFVASANCGELCGAKLDLVDISLKDFNISMDIIKKKLKEKNKPKVIIPVHLAGYPCDLKKLYDLTKKFKIKILEDASHAFGVRKNHESILNFGHLSILSFHATKVFNTFEGGAVICQTKEMKNQIDKLKNFGIESETSVLTAGINGKMSEFNSAFGLLQLKYIDEAISKRLEIDKMYTASLNSIENLEPIIFSKALTSRNYSYFPILVKPSYPSSRDELYWKMKSNGVHPRRYFYPLINEFQMYKHLPSSESNLMPVAKKTADEILCLPIYPDLDDSNVEFIVELLHPS